MPKKAKSGDISNPTHEMAVGKRMKLAIDAAGLTPTILAERLTAQEKFGKIATNRINGWINEGKKPQGWELVGAVAIECQVPLDWLINGSSQYVPKFMLDRIRDIYPEWVEREPVFAHIRIE